jgi:hypothetical protein
MAGMRSGVESGRACVRACAWPRHLAAQSLHGCGETSKAQHSSPVASFLFWCVFRRLFLHLSLPSILFLASVPLTPPRPPK